MRPAAPATATRIISLPVFYAGSIAPKIALSTLRATAKNALGFEFVEEAFYTIEPAFTSGGVLAIGFQ